MLTEEQIQSNFKRYLTALENLGINLDKLMTEIGVGLMVAPLTRTSETNGAYRGGLIEHILNVGKYAVKINDLIPEDVRLEQSSVLKVVFLHSLGMHNLYKEITSDWYIKKGIFYEYNNDKVSMSVGERSIKLIMDSNIELTEEEYQAILNVNKEDDVQSKVFTEMLGEVLKTSNTLANKVATTRNKK